MLKLNRVAFSLLTTVGKEHNYAGYLFGEKGDEIARDLLPILGGEQWPTLVALWEEVHIVGKCDVWGGGIKTVVRLLTVGGGFYDDRKPQDFDRASVSVITAFL